MAPIISLMFTFTLLTMISSFPMKPSALDVQKKLCFFTCFKAIRSSKFYSGTDRDIDMCCKLQCGLQTQYKQTHTWDGRCFPMIESWRRKSYYHNITGIKTKYFGNNDILKLIDVKIFWNISSVKHISWYYEIIFLSEAKTA